MILVLSFSLFFPSLAALPGTVSTEVLDIFLLPILPVISLYSKLSQATDMASFSPSLLPNILEGFSTDLTFLS